MNQKQIRAAVEKIISSIRKEGDKALFRIVHQHDKVKLTSKTVRVRGAVIDSAKKKLAESTRKAIDSCARRVQEFHYQEKKHTPQSWTYAKSGVRLGQIYGPVHSVGIYVPGGRFSYPSTVLMTAIPARMAGVERIVIVTPPGRLTPEVLYAAKVSGVTEIYRVGGPVAIAALAIGTESLPKVDLIVGPGNAFVTEAKRQLFGEVGIDLLAGPSELVVLADSSANPHYVAADMSAQAEHDPDSRSVLISLNRELLSSVKNELAPHLQKQCEFIFEPHRAKAIALANEMAGEHVQIMLEKPQDCLDVLKNGGAIFLNGWSPAVMGDYWAGPSHVLPTGRSARFASGLSIMTFLKRSSLIDISSAAFKKGLLPARELARVEGLVQHEKSLSIREND